MRQTSASYSQTISLDSDVGPPDRTVFLDNELSLSPVGLEEGHCPRRRRDRHAGDGALLRVLPGGGVSRPGRHLVGGADTGLHIPPGGPAGVEHDAGGSSVQGGASEMVKYVPVGWS